MEISNAPRTILTDYFYHAKDTLYHSRIFMITVSNIAKLMSGHALYTGASFQINPGEKIGLVGPNGSGKTTLFRMLVGELTPDEGNISIRNSCRVAYFPKILLLS